MRDTVHYGNIIFVVWCLCDSQAVIEHPAKKKYLQLDIEMFSTVQQSAAEEFIQPTIIHLWESYSCSFGFAKLKWELHSLRRLTQNRTYPGKWDKILHGINLA